MIPALARWNRDHVMTSDTTKEAAVAAEGLLSMIGSTRSRMGSELGWRLHRDVAGRGTEGGVVASALRPA
jgi:hypothetical protein